MDFVEAVQKMSIPAPRPMQSLHTTPYEHCRVVHHWRHEARTLSQQSFSEHNSGRAKGSNRPSEDDSELTDKELKRQKIGLIIGPVWFVLLMYLCFFREEKDGGIMVYLSQDPRYNDRLPEEVKQKARKLYGDSDR